MRRLIAMSLLVCCSGCVQRSAGGERYFGPTLYRHASTEADVVETMHVGVLGEVGTQWGGALGYVRRTAVAPVDGAIESAREWTAVFPLALGDAADGWKLSLFHLRRESGPDPMFVRRVVLGARAGVGSEVRSLALGYAATTTFTPGADVVGKLCFRTDSPLRSQLAVWPHTALGDDTLARAFEEECP